jgi:hypothetical protein
LCTNASNTARYYAKYRQKLLAARREKEQQNKAIRIEHTDEQRAYMAGIVDGEGSIQIRCHGTKGGKTGHIGQYTLIVQVVNTSKPLIDWLVENWGGATAYTPEKSELNRKAKWSWSVTANNALRVLDEVYEFLVIKRTQCKLGRRFQRYAQRTGRERTERITRLHHRFFSEMRILNKRGVN